MFGVFIVIFIFIFIEYANYLELNSPALWRGLGGGKALVKFIYEHLY